MKKNFGILLVFMVSAFAFAQSSQKLGITGKECKTVIKSVEKIELDLKQLDKDDANYLQNCSAVLNKYGIKGDAAYKKYETILNAAAAYALTVPFENLSPENKAILDNARENDPVSYDFFMSMVKDSEDVLAKIHPEDKKVLDQNKYELLEVCDRLAAVK